MPSSSNVHNDTFCHLWRDQVDEGRFELELRREDLAGGRIWSSGSLCRYVTGGVIRRRNPGLSIQVPRLILSMFECRMIRNSPRSNEETINTPLMVSSE